MLFELRSEDQIVYMTCEEAPDFELMLQRYTVHLTNVWVDEGDRFIFMPNMWRERGWLKQVNEIPHLPKYVDFDDTQVSRFVTESATL